MDNIWLHGELEVNPDQSKTDAYLSLCDVAEQCGYAINQLGPNHLLAATEERTFLLQYNDDVQLTHVYRLTPNSRLALPDNAQPILEWPYHMTLYQAPPSQLWVTTQHTNTPLEIARLTLRWSRTDA